MSTVSQLYSNNNAITITLDSLGNSSVATSNAIDNSLNEFISADLQLVIKTGITVDTANGSITVFLIRSADGGVTYDDSNQNADVIGVYDANVATTTFTFSADLSRLGTLPCFWKIAVMNNSGGALDATPANFNAFYSGKNFKIT